MTTSHPPANARALAWQILQRVESEGAYADALLGRELRASALAARDQALLTRLVYGTLAWQGYLDHIITAFARRPPADLDVPVRIILRLALFQTCVLTKIPDFAAVDTAVRLAKRFRGGAAVSLVNAILRRATAGWRQVPFPSPDDDPAGYLALRLSHPRWLVEHWLSRFGFEETEALLRANNEPAPTVLRVNRTQIDPGQLLTRLRGAGYAVEPTAYSPVGIGIESAGTPERIAGYDEGLFSLQGEAAQLVSFLAAPHGGACVLDACAAPGGKATHLAELMGDRGEIIALDINRRGLARVERMAQRLHLSIVQTAAADATTWLPSGESFDCVLVDAPCSGLGTLRQHPEVKWRRSPSDITARAGLQQRLLFHLADCVRPGGTLVYATCTLTGEENENVLAAFLRRQPQFVIADPRPLLPDNARHLISTDGVLRTFPHRHGLDGFFAVRLQRVPGRHQNTVAIST